MSKFYLIVIYFLGSRLLVVGTYALVELDTNLPTVKALDKRKLYVTDLSNFYFFLKKVDVPHAAYGLIQGNCSDLHVLSNGHYLAVHYLAASGRTSMC